MKKQVVVWFFSISFIIASLGAFSTTEIVPGIAALIAGMLLLPPIGNIITGVTGKPGSIALRAAITVICLLVVGATMKPEPEKVESTVVNAEKTANTPEEKIGQIVENLGCKPIEIQLIEQAATEWDEEQVKRIQAGEQISTGKYLVKIAYESLEGLTGKQTKKFVHRKAMEIIKELSTKPDFSNIVSFMLMPYANIPDKYGNVKMEQVGKFVLSRDVTSKINWDNMYEEKFTGIVQSEGQLLLHPAMR